MQRLYLVSKISGKIQDSMLTAFLGKLDTDSLEAGKSAIRIVAKSVIKRAKKNIRTQNAGTGYPQTGRLARSIKLAEIQTSRGRIHGIIEVNGGGKSPQASAMDEPVGTRTPLYAKGKYMVFYWHRTIMFAYAYKKRTVLLQFPGKARFDVTHIHGTAFLSSAFNQEVANYDEIIFEELNKRL